MLLIRNNAVLTTPLAITTAATKVPFDTVVIRSNDTLALDDSTVVESVAGLYDTECSVTLENASSSAAATVTLQAYADGTPVTGAKATATIAASSTGTIVLPWATRVIPAAYGTARLAWYLSGGAVNLTNAIAKIEKLS